MSEAFDLGPLVSGNSSSSSSASSSRRRTRSPPPGGDDAKRRRTDPDEEQCRRVVPTLRELCLRFVADRLERVPPRAFASLPPDHWEDVLRRRYVDTAPKNGGGGDDELRDVLADLDRREDDLPTRRSPAVSPKVLGDVEEANEHLSGSLTADALVWRDCVEYSFPPGPGRPKALLAPWRVLTRRLTDAARELAERVDGPVTTDTIERVGRALGVLADAPMSVRLLDETKVGKTVARTIKRLRSTSSSSSSWADREFSVDVTADAALVAAAASERRSASLLDHLETTLRSWKSTASAGGVKVSSASSSSSSSSSFKGKQTSAEQHALDLRVLEMCSSWRLLYQALSERKDHMLRSHGNRMREIRKNIESRKRETKSVRLKTTPRFSAGSSSVAGLNKVSAWRKDLATHKATQKRGATATTQRPVSAFSAAVKNATASRSKRAAAAAAVASAPVNKRRTLLINGRRLQMPKRTEDNRYRSNQIRSKAFRKSF